jgi:O-acetyl-ADP-ribose deacetylase (regulator of RNase III)
MDTRLKNVGKYMITYNKGNLLDTPDNFIAHGCNAQGVMGSGVAKAIKEKWPEAYNLYRRNYLSKDGLIVGTVNRAYIKEDLKCIMNCITQEYYGRDGKQYVDYKAISDCFYFCCFVVSMETPEGKTPSISIPKIGAGLGGGDWKIISNIINEISDKYRVTVNVWEL